MSGIKDTATVTLNVNGAQAKQMMADVEAKIKQTEATIDRLKKSMADPKDIEKAKKELRTYQKQLDEMKSATEGVNRALENLELATPRELERALRTLNRQLKDMVPGTEVWDSHVEKIKELKERLTDLRGELQEQSTLWNKLQNWANDIWPVIDLFSRGYDTVVSGLREYVNAYADMDQEMANVRKFTGMTEEQVASLNERFKEIDTRSSREELNRLAQEAGRLGKTSEEDVLGFVRAADKINVALDDLGEGATLTLSKLTGIFGDEQRYGTEQSLLKVGSVINELSQNCSASAPYIAHFAERIGGVGSQANLTIPQIMGFAAVLDSNAQKLEASSTALSQVIVRLYQDPAKYARVAGLDAQKFATLMREDANAALILFLETLQKAGGMDKLSPMFKEMGENGSRAIAALSTLATHIEEVKTQQAAANEAFREGTSIDTEFAVQNNTVQAALEKCKNRANELRVELGQHLYPLMKHFLTTGAAIMRVLLESIQFVAQHKAGVIALAAAITTYVAVLKGELIVKTVRNGLDKLHYYYLVLESKATKALAVVTEGMRLAYYKLTGQVSKAIVAQKAFNTAMASTPWGAILSAITAAILAFNLFKNKVDEAAKEAEEYKKKLTDLDEAASSYAAQECSRLDALYDAATNEAKSTDERREAAEKLQNLYPDYFKNLSAEEIMVGNAKVAYDNLRDSIIEVARARAAAAKIQQNEEELLTLEQQVTGLREKRDRDKATYDRAVAEWENARQQESVQVASYGNSTDAAVGQMVDVAPYARRVASTGQTYQASEAAYQKNITRQQQLNEANEFLRDKYKISAESLMEPENPVINLDVPPGGTTDKDRFAAEKEWRERMEALARIDYATGKTDYLAYTKEMNDIAVDFYEQQLLHEDLTETERLKITAQWREAQKKQAEAGEKLLADAESQSYNSRMAELKQFYLDGQISKETYDRRVEELEIYHQNNLVKLAKAANEQSVLEENKEFERKVADLEELYANEEITKEVHDRVLEELERLHQARLAEIRQTELAAQDRLFNLQINQMNKRQQETARLEKEYASMKERFFGDNPTERQEKYDTAFETLKTVYERELAMAGENADEKLRIEEAFLQAQNELRREYGLDAENDTRNSMERAVASSVEWLNSDGGKAVTGTISTLASGMSSIFSGLSTMMQAELELQTAAIEKKYDKEISLAQGNSYKVAKLEEQKEAEIAKAKNEANKKMFAMQVIQAVAQTAQNALSAYGSAAAVPVVGYILAPIAAAMAVAAGAIQIAAIKKQQQASEAQGYSQGGFTKKGGVNEPAGIVHAGEWVASQKLLANPVARPMIEALDQAQRTNTIGSLRAEDVSRSITASQSLVRMSESDNSSLVMAAVASRMSSAVADLTSKLNEPFVTINTVTGDLGIQKAQREYTRLINNKSPKSKRKWT